MPGVLTAWPREQWRVYEKNGYMSREIYCSQIIQITVIMAIIDITNTQASQLKGRIKLLSMTFCIVPYHQEVLRAHQSHFCLWVIVEDRGFQSDVSDIQTETEQICQAEQREWGNCPTCQRSPDGFCGNPGHRIPHVGPRRPPMCARCDDVPVMPLNNQYNVIN